MYTVIISIRWLQQSAHSFTLQPAHFDPSNSQYFNNQQPVDWRQLNVTLTEIHTAHVTNQTYLIETVILLLYSTLYCTDLVLFSVYTYLQFYWLLQRNSVLAVFCFCQLWVFNYFCFFPSIVFFFNLAFNLIDLMLETHFFFKFVPQW